ncbi:unnamed protein product [Rotaria sordida]|nr:unnamed protein product [Rotaria sordida]
MTTYRENLEQRLDLKIELDKRKQIINSLIDDYPQIVQFISIPIEQLIGNIQRIKTNRTRKQEVNSSKIKLC